MGIILDTSVLIAAERERVAIATVLHPLRTRSADPIGLSAVTVSELTHGIHRAQNTVERQNREHFAAECYRILPVYPVTFEIAALAGSIEAGLASRGTPIGFEDIVIGATALYLGYSVATYNLRHFQLIPDLQVFSPISIS